MKGGAWYVGLLVVVEGRRGIFAQSRSWHHVRRLEAQADSPVKSGAIQERGTNNGRTVTIVTREQAMYLL